MVFGLVASDGDKYLVAIRGTEGQIEWNEDFDSDLSACVFLPGARTHEGFTLQYDTLRINLQPDNPDGDWHYLRTYLTSLRLRDKEVVIAGHSLGAALADLAAADFGGCTSLLFARPNVGDYVFEDMAQSRAKERILIEVTGDLVSHVPVYAPGYEYEQGRPTIRLNPSAFVSDEVGCLHNLLTYLNLLDSSIAVAPQCSLNAS